MTTALTADVHISSRHPERGRALKNIVADAKGRGVQEVIIAGDCFDGPVSDASLIDSLADGSMKITLLRGNHDSTLRKDFFTSPGVEVVEEPLLRRGRVPMLLLPYREGDSMGNVISRLPCREELKDKNWVLISHGDFGRFTAEEKGGEKGYFPLTRRDLQRYRPALTILGHIHRGHEAAQGIHYTGSPWPLDITERGPRTYLVLDEERLFLERCPVPGAAVNEIVTLPVVPGTEEARQVEGRLIDFLKNFQASHRIDAGALTLRVVARGYALDRAGIASVIKETCAAGGVSLESIDLEGLRPLENRELLDLAAEVVRGVKEFNLDYPADEITEDDVIEKALEIVYG